MTAIRPPAFPPIRTPDTSGAPNRADAGKSAAQKAFFQAALGQAAPAAVAQAAPQTTFSNPAAPAPASVQRIPDPGAEKPQKILRPGSLLDIRV